MHPPKNRSINNTYFLPVKVTNDFRWMNNFIWGMCKFGANISKTPEELVEKLS